MYSQKITHISLLNKICVYSTIKDFNIKRFVVTLWGKILFVSQKTTRHEQIHHILTNKYQVRALLKLQHVEIRGKCKNLRIHIFSFSLVNLRPNRKINDEAVSCLCGKLKASSLSYWCSVASVMGWSRAQESHLMQLNLSLTMFTYTEHSVFPLILKKTPLQ